MELVSVSIEILTLVIGKVNYYPDGVNDIVRSIKEHAEVHEGHAEEESKV